MEITLRLGSLLRTVLITPLIPEALRDDEERVVVQPWNLSHKEFIVHGFDQLRLASREQPEVIGTLLRVLRMLADHVRDDHPELIPVLDRQSRLILESLPTDLHPEDLARLRALTSDKSDPADHSR